jgi:hypothetical protein
LGEDLKTAEMPSFKRVLSAGGSTDFFINGMPAVALKGTDFNGVTLRQVLYLNTYFLHEAESLLRN